MSSSSYEVVLTSSPDGLILVYEASTGNTVARFTGSRSPRRGVTVVGKCFIAASHVSPDTDAVSIHLYNWYTSTVFYSFPVPEFVAPLIATSDGAYLFAGGISGSVHSFSLPSGDIVRSFPAHRKPISCLLLSDDGSLLISGSEDGSIVVIPTFQVVETSSTEEDPKVSILHQLKAHSDSVTALSAGIGLCNSTLISCSLDSTCKFWSLVDGTLLRTVSFPCAIFGIAIDSAESDFYAAGSDGLVYKGSMKVGSRKLLSKAHELVTWNNQSHNGSVLSVVLVNEGKNLVSASEDGSVWMWEVEKEEVATVLGNNGVMGSISDMIVARGTEYRGRGRNGGGGGNFSLGLCEEEVVRSMKKILELGDILSVVVEDRKRAIDMLESAIAVYERLLELILEEALKGTSSTGEDVEKEEIERTSN